MPSQQVLRKGERKNNRIFLKKASIAKAATTRKKMMISGSGGDPRTA